MPSHASSSLHPLPVSQNLQVLAGDHYKDTGCRPTRVPLINNKEDNRRCVVFLNMGTWQVSRGGHEGQSTHEPGNGGLSQECENLSMMLSRATQAVANGKISCLWLNNIPSYICTTSSSIHILTDT